MMDPAIEFRFIAIDKPGEKRRPELARVVRSHVRRAISRTQKQRTALENIKFITQTIGRRPRKQPKSKTRSRGISSPSVRPSNDCKHDIAERTPSPTERCTHFVQEGYRGQSSGSSSSSDCDATTAILAAPVVHHPLTAFAEPHCRLSSERLDALFKSEACRSSAEPLFDTDHIESIMTVYHDCLREPVFMKTLVYSVVQTEQAQSAVLTSECFRLRGEAINTLNDQLANGPHQPSMGTIGAIMTMKAASAKCGDLASYKAHSVGLTKALKLISSDRSKLTAKLHRVLFWLDLFGSVLTGTPRQMSHLMIPDADWCQSGDLVGIPHVPIGYERHRDLLPDNLLDCIENLVEFQWKLATHQEQLEHLDKDNMQASIQSRLAFQEKACQRFGPLAEATRLATFITAYVSWTKVWNSSLIPSKIAEQLLNLLNDTVFIKDCADGESMDYLDDALWNNRYDLLLWLVFVGACVAQRGEAHVPGIRLRYGNLVRRLHDAFQKQYFIFCFDANLYHRQLSNLRAALHRALHDFSYAGDWLKQRMRIEGWFELELLLESGIQALP